MIISWSDVNCVVICLWVNLVGCLVYWPACFTTCPLSRQWKVCLCVQSVWWRVCVCLRCPSFMLRCSCSSECCCFACHRNTSPPCGPPWSPNWWEPDLNDHSLFLLFHSLHLLYYCSSHSYKHSLTHSNTLHLQVQVFLLMEQELTADEDMSR